MDVEAADTRGGQKIDRSAGGAAGFCGVFHPEMNDLNLMFWLYTYIFFYFISFCFLNGCDMPKIIIKRKPGL